jgi:CheY-like chemotaxis protein
MVAIGARRLDVSTAALLPRDPHAVRDFALSRTFGYHPRAMSTESSRPTPLGVARARFVEGLPRKAQELKGSVALLAGTPNDEKPREELRRRLHALYASAQVFQLERLAGALKDAIGKLDRARDERRGLTNDDLDQLALLSATLPMLGADAPAHDPEQVTIPKAPAVPSAPPPAGLKGNTLKGILGVPPVPPPPKVVVPPPPPPSIAPVPAPAPSLREELAASIEQRAAPPAPSLHRAPVVSVLVCDGAETQARVRGLLPSERFEVLGAADPEEALRIARSSAPDVVLVDHAILTRAGSDLIRRLRDDPLTDFVPVVVMASDGVDLDPLRARELGCEEVLRRPLEAAAIERVVVHLAGLGGGGAAAAMSGDLTVTELAAKIADEIRRGLVESVDRGRDLAVPIGDGTEVLAATWSAIGRLRAHLANRSGGRVHFREREGGAATLALVDDEGAAVANAEVSLRDRRILIADDDPAVTWFFSNLLREAGAIPTEALDGAEALESARRSRPDVVIADILMPKLDGFSLTRELKRDPVLSDVPVVLLSWKEDFLQRMRELSVGASGYLRKEAGASQILSAVREVLRPRARLEERLRAGGDVRGRLDRIGIIPLLHTAAQHRPDARITVRDAWNLFEIDLRKKSGDATGSLVDITRTASDGSFTRGPRVVTALLGASEGRFTVADSDTPVRASVREPLATLLTRASGELSGLVEAVSGRGLLLAHRVEFDEDVLSSILRAAPATVAAVVDNLRRGKGPRALVVDGTFAPNDVEHVLVDLARQGAITAVFGDGNDDRVSAARKERGETALPVRTPSLLPPADPDAMTTAPGLDLSWTKSEEATGDIVRSTLAGAGQPLVVPPTQASSLDALDATETDDASAALAVPPKPATITVRTGSNPPRELPPENAPSDEYPIHEESHDEPDDEEEDEVDEPEAPAPVATPTPRAEPARPAPEPTSSGMTAFQWTFTLALLAAVGFAGWRLTHPAQVTEPPPSGVVVAPTDAAVVLASDAGAAIIPPTDLAPPVTSAFTSYGRDEDGIASSFHVAAAAGQGLLVFEPGDEPMILRVGADVVGRLDRAPIAVALPEGIHDLAFIRGDGTSFRFARVIAGHTRYAPAP